MISAFSLCEDAPLTEKPHRTGTDESAPTRMRQRGRTQDAARRPAHRYTQSAREDPLRTAQAAQSASSFFHALPSAKRKTDVSEQQLAFACARALISADAFITSTSHMLFTPRNAPTSGVSALRFDSAAATTSRYVRGSAPYKGGAPRDDSPRARYSRRNRVPETRRG